MPQLFAVIICLLPLILFGGGYYIGRYGSPIVITRQRRRDRRRRPQRSAPEDEHEDVDVFHADI